LPSFKFLSYNLPSPEALKLIIYSFNNSVANVIKYVNIIYVYLLQNIMICVNNLSVKDINYN